MTAATPRQRELLAHIGSGGVFARHEPGKPWRLVDEGSPLSSWISDAGLSALFHAGWIDGGASTGNMTEFAPILTESGRDALGEARIAQTPAPPATPDDIDADIVRRRAVGLTNAEIVKATGRTSCRVLHVLDDDIPDAPAPARPRPRDIDPSIVDAEPPRPAAGTAGSSSGDPWMADEIEALTKTVAAALERRGPYRPHRPLFFPFRRIGHALGRTEAAVRRKAAPIIRSAARTGAGNPETKS